RHSRDLVIHSFPTRRSSDLTWTNRGTIKGSDGTNGTNGTNGVDGSKWLSGTSNPTSATGVLGDWYINYTSWDVFEKTGATTWTNRGNIKGAPGSGSTAGLESIRTDNSSSPGPAFYADLYFNFHEYWGFPQAFADETQPGNATAKATDGQLDFFASYDSVHTMVEYGGTADVSMKDCHIVNVLLMTNGGDVNLQDGVYTGDQVNITTTPGNQINIYANNLLTTAGNEVWSFANLVWDCEHTAWVITGFGTP